jgi:two-component system sensor histidine kinase UhpB
VTLADGVRRRSHDLHPATLGLLGLASAIKGHCIEVRKRHSVDVRFVDEGDLGPVDQRVAVCLFRVAQEALRNGLVHGAARRLVVSLGRFGDMIELNVTDDGSGFDLESVRRSGSGLGLVSIEERAYALGGEVHITSHPGLGTTVHVRVPAAARTSSERWGQSVSTAAAPEAALPALETV